MGGDAAAAGASADFLAETRLTGFLTVHRILRLPLLASQREPSKFNAGIESVSIIRVARAY